MPGVVPIVRPRGLSSERYLTTYAGLARGALTPGLLLLHRSMLRSCERQSSKAVVEWLGGIEIIHAQPKDPRIRTSTGTCTSSCSTGAGTWRTTRRAGSSTHITLGAPGGSFTHQGADLSLVEPRSCSGGCFQSRSRTSQRSTTVGSWKPPKTTQTPPTRRGGGREPSRNLKAKPRLALTPWGGALTNE
jgi:hypothetical protein